MPSVLIDPDTGQEFEDLYDPDEFAQDSGPDYWGAAKEGISSLFSGPAQLAVSFDQAQREHPYLSAIPVIGPQAAATFEAGKFLYDNPKAIAPAVAGAASTGIGVGASPLAGALSVPTLQYGAQRVNDYFWPEDAQTPKEQVEQLTRDITGSVGPAVVGPIAGKMGAATIDRLGDTWLAKGAAKVANSFNAPREKYIADWKEANQPGSSAAVFNAPKGTTGPENQVPVDLMKYEDTFYDIAPFEGVSPAPGKNASQEILNNLLPAGEKALGAKTALLQQLDQVGPGISFNDLDLSSLDRSLQKASSSAFASADPTNDVIATLRASFNQPGNYSAGKATNYINPSNVQTILTTVDDRIREIGGWDKRLKAGALLTPSQSASIEQLPQLLKVRESLRGALESYSDAYSSAPGAMNRLNQVIATTREYGDVIQRHIPEVVQGMTRDFAPGRSMTSPTNPSSAWNSPTNTLLNAATGGYAKELARAGDRIANVDSSWETPARLQRFAELRNQPFAPPPGVLQGGWDKMASGLEAIMGKLAPQLGFLRTLDPTTGMVHDPQERAALASTVSSMKGIDPAAKFQALSDIHAGSLPAGSVAQPPQQELPQLDTAFKAAMNAGPEHEQYGPPTEDELLMQQLDYFASTDYDSSGL